MTDLAVSKPFLALSSFKETLIVDLDQYDELLLNRDEELISKDNSKAESDENYDGCVPVVSSTFSPCGKRFLCCAHKSLSVWSVVDWKLIGKKIIQRSASKVIFSPKSNYVIVADKSGDVYLHTLSDFGKPGELILGHVSMLLDVLITPDEKFIITCDRDEKIRVSCFPNAYNINSYCLGHDDFVTCINLIDQTHLLSGSGDGTFKIWDYKKGEELFSYSVKNDVSSLRPFEDSLPVVYKVSVLKLSDGSTIVCSLVFKTNAIWLYNVNHSPTITLKFSKFIRTEHEPYALQSSPEKCQLWFLQLDQAEPIKCFSLLQSEFLKDENFNKVEQVIKKHVDVLSLNKLYERQISSLCKKKFDNESDYYKRKNERIEAEKVKKLAKS